MTTVLLYILGVLIFAVGIGVSIGLHELGHMIPAKRFGVKVTQYFVGFGPTVWSKKKGETEYGVKWIPFGGYVKLVGMLPPEKATADGLPVQEPKGFGKLIADARAAEYSLVEPGDEDRLFYRKAWWKKLIVMAGGPTVNIAIAFVLFACVFGFYGVATVHTTAAQVTSCTAALCADPTGQTPAEKAGLQAGDKVVSFNGTKVADWEQLQKDIRGAAGKTVTLGVVRDGTNTDLTATIATLPPAEGQSAAEAAKIGFLGMVPTSSYVKHGPIYTIGRMGEYTKDTVIALAHMPARLYDVAKTALGLQPRAADSPMSIVGAGRVAGEVSATHEETVGSRAAQLAALLGGVNLFLGMFNFLPLLPLDGGHIAGALWEAIRRGFAKVLKRPDPGFVDIAKLLPVAYVVAGVFLLMTVMLIYTDLIAPVPM